MDTKAIEKRKTGWSDIVCFIKDPMVNMVNEEGAYHHLMEAQPPRQYSQAVIDQLWEKAEPVEGLLPDTFRLDAMGALIMKDKFWMWNPFGWVIYNTKGDSPDDTSNLIPLHGKNYAVRLGKCKYPIKFNGKGNCEVDDVGHYPIDIFEQIVDNTIAPLQESLKELTEVPRTRENLRQYGEKIEKQAERVVGALKEMEEALRVRGL